MSEGLKQTALIEIHRALGARLVPFAGWEMPVQYTSIIEEHKAVREKAGWFDVSHMGELLVTGPGAVEALNRLVTNDLSRLRDGKAIYSPVCYADGGVVDDVIVYQLEAERLLICVNASNRRKDYEWIKEQLSGTTVRVEDVSDEWAQVAIQGPNAWPMLCALEGGIRGTEIPGRFEFRQLNLLGVDVLLSRTGYTGEDGCEVYLAAAKAADFMSRLLEVSSPHGLQAAGLGARDSLRLEAGYPLYGHEISDKIDPLTAGLGFAVKLAKADGFIGSEALLAKQQVGLTHAVRYFKLDDRRIARAGAAVVDADGNACGEVLSGTLSPILQQPIGSALIETKFLAREAALFVDIRGNRLPLTLAKPPLHKS